MHDVGKISIPDSILLKPGRLPDAEFYLMKAHTAFSVDLLRSFEDVWASDCLSVRDGMRARRNVGALMWVLHATEIPHALWNALLLESL